MKYTITTVFLLLALSACNKHKLYQCSYTYSNIPSYIAFAGFDTTELHTINIREYAPDGTYAQLLQSTTLVSDSLYYENDVVYRGPGKQFFATLYGGKQYEIEVPAASRTFRIDGIFYTGPGTQYYESEDCSGPGRTFVRGADSAAVDGQPASPGSYGSTTYFVLRK